MSVCSIKRCRNYSGMVDKNCVISYHSFPHDPIMKHKWIAIVQAERSEYDWMPKRTSKICSVHFKYEDKFTALNGYMRLKKTALPEIEGLVINNKHVNNGSNEDALEHLHSSDPSASKSLLFMALTKKMKEGFDFHESQDDDILNLHTHIDIKQEDIQDIDASVPTFSCASCSTCSTNSACGSPTRESHIETFTEYEPQNKMDVIVMKEETGIPLSDISIHSDAADSPEEQEIKNTLRKKMKMLDESEDTLSRIHRQISILQKKRKELVTNIKYLQHMSKKKCKLFDLKKL